MKPAYDYYLKVDDDFYFLPVHVTKEGDCYLIRAAHFNETMLGWNEQEMYAKFEKRLGSTLMRYHIAGDLHKVIPSFKNTFSAQTCRLVAYPYVPSWKKKLNKLIRRIQNWRIQKHGRADI